ncbi:hypothetical protein EDC01DRAFT_628147 [Geopyxis carbonaria]|nr:hypothetical protein EDC01DRAFT_628147 [Geopyxis carbonaria]
MQSSQTRPHARSNECTDQGSDTYDEVHALVLHWEEPLLDESLNDLPAELGQLARFFKSTMRYNVHDQYRIPRNNPAESLKAEIQRIKGKFVTGNRGLFIIFYGGHAKSSITKSLSTKNNILQTTSDESLLLCPEPNGGRSVNWTETQKSAVESLSQDILIVLDCCHAAHASKDGGFKQLGDRRAEILASSSLNMEASPPGSCSFTNRFVEYLKQAVESPAGKIDTRALHGELTRRHDVTPVLRDLVEARLPSIVLGRPIQQTVSYPNDLPSPITVSTSRPSSNPENEDTEIMQDLTKDLPSTITVSTSRPSSNPENEDTEVMQDLTKDLPSPITVSTSRPSSNLENEDTEVMQDLTKDLKEVPIVPTFDRARNILQRRNPRFQYAQLRDTCLVVIEYRPKYESEGYLKTEVEELATKLSSLYQRIGPSEIKILRCRGYARRGNDYGLVFEFPEESSANFVPITLREIIEHSEFGPALEQLDALFKSIIKTNSKLNLQGLQHGGITTEDIIFFSEDFKKPWIFGCGKRSSKPSPYKSHPRPSLTSGRSHHGPKSYNQQFNDPRVMGRLLLCIGLWRTEKSLERLLPPKLEVTGQENTEWSSFSQYWKRCFHLHFLHARAQDTESLLNRLANSMGTRYKVVAGLLFNTSIDNIEGSSTCFQQAEKTLTLPVDVWYPPIPIINLPDV